MHIRKVDQIKNQLNEKLGGSSDFLHKKLASQTCVSYCFLNSMVDEDKIYNYIIKPADLMVQKQYISHLLSLPAAKGFESEEKTLIALLKGSAILFFKNDILIIKVKRYESSGVSQVSKEVTVHGPQDALSENLDINLNLLRHRYYESTLVSEEVEMNFTTKPKVLLVYDQKNANPSILKRLKQQLASLDGKTLPSVGFLSKMLNRRRALFPTLITTERPDRIIYNLSKGKIILMLEGSPFAIVLPVVFFDYISSMDDLYQTYWIGKFLIILRYIAMVVSVVTPALYVAATAFNPGLLQIQLALSIAGSRASVPYSASFEIIFMLLFMEFLIEASIRLPKMISPAATTVGGLILGQAATNADLVSNIMVIIIAAVAISNFVIPISEMSFALRLSKYLLLILAMAAGLTGVVIGIAIFFVYLIRLESFGEPYIKI